MIKNLKIINFVLFESVNIDFNKNTNALVGDTGAGKSVIFSAINVLCGQRNNSKLIMKSKDFYELEMIIDISKISSKNLLEISKIIGIKSLNEIKVYRKLDLNGKGVIKVNENIVSIVDLKNIMKNIINIHSQDSVNEILKEDNHINIINNLIDSSLLEEYYKKYDIYSNSLKLVKELNAKDESKEEELEILDFKLANLSKLNNILEEEELEKQKDILENKSKLKEQNSIIEKELNSAYNSLRVCKENINSNISKELEQKIEDLYYGLEEVSFEHSKTLDFSSDYNIDDIMEQINTLRSLKRKYSLDFEGLMQKYKELKQEKEFLENLSFEIVNQEKELKKHQEEILEISKEISQKRKEVSKSLEKTINKHFKDLNMEDAELKIIIEEKAISNEGIDDVKILIKTNKGHDFNIINEVASGGEKSRIMLILKMALNKYNPILIYLLDEIDQGISSKVATNMGDKLIEFSNDSQILIISHTVQVINKMQELFEVRKDNNKDYSISYVKKLSTKEKEKFITNFLKI